MGTKQMQSTLIQKKKAFDIVNCGILKSKLGNIEIN